MNHTNTQEKPEDWIKRYSVAFFFISFGLIAVLILGFSYLGLG